MSETIDRMCDEARARLKHWIGTKAGIAKAQLGRNHYQEAYSDMVDRDPMEGVYELRLSRAADPLEGFRDKRGPEFERRPQPRYDLYAKTTPIYHEPFITEQQ